MKIALVLYGQPRNVIDNFNSFQNSIFNGNNIDVFGHFWEVDEYKEALELFSFKEYILEEQKNFSEFYIGKSGLPKFENNAPMWYTTQMGCNLLKNYVNKTGTKYDFVIRARFDIFFRHIIDFSKLESGYLYVSELAWKGSHMCDDSWTICDYDTYISIYSDLFDRYWEKHLHSTYIDRSEQNFYEHLVEKNLLDIVKRERMIDFALYRDKSVNY